MNNFKKNVRSKEIPAPVQVAWIADAKIAKKVGYPCAGTLVEYSVYGEIFFKRDGFFYKKIRESQEFKNWKINDSIRNHIEFNSDNDLYYAIHGANINATFNQFIIYDVFDFKYENFKFKFSTLVNNWVI